MLPSFKKTIATSLILGLVFPYISYAAVDTNINVDIETDTGTGSDNTNIAAEDDNSPNTNFNNVAPTITTVVNTGASTVTTTTVPTIDAAGAKEEGVWNFTVSRYGESETTSMRHDLTPPACPPAPTPSQYENDNDYYTSNNLVNPWPIGLNGEWANNVISFPDNNPSLCRDQITIKGTKYVEQNYTTGVCENADGSPLHNYKEDLEDCLREQAGNNPNQTRPLSQMAGCKYTTMVEINQNETIQDFALYDLAQNQTNTPGFPVCKTPTAKIDKESPTIDNVQIEHEGLELPKENLKTNVSNPNTYRADAGELLFYANIKDVDPTTESGMSGLNWEPLFSTTEIDELRYDIANAENLLTNQIGNLSTHEADIILMRSNILQKIASLQRHIIINNLLHKISGEVNNTSNFFMQAIVSLAPGLSAFEASSGKVSSSLLRDIKNQISLAKFDDVTQIEIYRDNINDLSVSLVNDKIDDYINELPRLLGRSTVSETGDEIDITSTNNKFNSAYNQWQIDKNKNYSLVFPTWLEDLEAIDDYVEQINTDYQEIKLAYESNDLMALAAKLEELSPESRLLSLLLSTETAATDHVVSQQETLNLINDANDALSNTKSYLQAFDPSTDSFSNSKITQIEDNLLPADDAAGALQRALLDTETPGSLAHSLHGISSIESSNEILQLINAEQSSIRQLSTEIQEISLALAEKEDDRDLLNEQIISQENAIIAMKSDLAELIEERDNLQASSSTLTFDQQGITHLEIERLSGENTQSQDFFPPTTTPSTGNTFIWDLNSFKFEDESAPIFTKAGKYLIKLKVYDKALNKRVFSGYIEIFPAKLEVEVSSNCNTVANAAVADGVEYCNIELPQLDIYGNKIQSDKSLKLTVRDQDINGSYDLVESLGANYQNGIRFDGGTAVGNKHQLTWTPNSNSQKIVNLKSLLPTVTVLPYEGDTRYGVGFNLDSGLELPLILEHPNVTPRGTIDTSNPLVDNVTLPVQFKPWINVAAKGETGSFDNSRWNPPVAVPFNVYVDASTGSSKNLPSNFTVALTGFVNDSYEFNNVDLAHPGVEIDFNSVSDSYVESTGSAGNPDPVTTTINSTSLLSGQQSNAALFIPVAKYTLDGKNIVMPGTPAGSCPDQEACLPTPPTTPAVPTISNAGATEGGSINFQVSLSKPAEEAIAIYFNATDTTTTIGDDYTFSPAQALVIEEGQSSATYTMSTLDDLIVEDTETFTLSIDSFEPAGALENYDDTGTGSIYDNDNTLTITEGVVTEGEICLMDVRLIRPSSEDITFNASVGATGDTATSGSDYNAANVSGTIPAGESAILIPIQTIEDNIKEGSETFTVTIDSVEGGELSAISSVSQCEIEDNDREPNVYLLNTTVNEGDRAQITVVLGEGDQSGLPDNEEVELRLETYDLGSEIQHATAGQDYQSRIFDITIPAGVKTYTLPLASGIQTTADDLVEVDENFGVRVVSVLQGRIGTYSDLGNVTILDQTVNPKPSIENISTEYGVEDTPNDTIEFDVILDYPNETGDDITITLETEDVTATGGDDYTPGDLTVIIPHGQKSGKSTPVIIQNDDIAENQETFEVKFKSVSPNNALLTTTAEGEGRIIDNDDRPLPNILIHDAIACESANCNNTTHGTILFEVSLDRPHYDASNAPLVVSYTPTPLTAAPNTDYAPGEYEAQFNVGEQIATLEPINLVNDADEEDMEEFEMSFVRVESGHTLGNTTDTAIGQITDQDTSGAQPSIIISDASGIEGERAQFTVGLDYPAQGQLTVELNTQNISTQNADYTCPANMTVIFPNGDMTPQTIYCDLNLDDVNEDLEKFEVLVSNVTGNIKSGGDNAKGEASIHNLQTLDVVIEAPDPVMENDASGLVEFTVNLADNGNPVDADTGLEQPMFIEITPEDLAAIGGSNLNVTGVDYRSGVINLNLVPGKGLNSTTATIGVEINNDTILEVNPAAAQAPENRQENFNMALDSSSLNIKGFTEAEGIIQDDDDIVCTDKANVKVLDLEVIEGETANFDISLDRTLCDDISTAVTLNFRTVDGGAVEGLDFNGRDVSVTIPAGERRPNAAGLLAIQTIADGLYEGNENFRLEFVSASPASVINRVERWSIRSDNSHQNRGTEPTVATIIDIDEPDYQAPEMIIEDSSATEGSNLNFVVKLSKTNSAEDTIIRLQASRSGSNGADAGTDFTTGSGIPVIAVVSIAAGQGAGQARITTVDDAVVESDEELILNYIGLDSGFLSNTDDTAIGTIVDNDSGPAVKPNVVITDASAIEGEGMNFLISLEDAVGNRVFAPTGGIDFNIETGTLSGPDTASSGEFGAGATVRINQGDSDREFTISTTDDVIEENNEIFNVSIASSNKASFVNNLNATATGTIIDNDSSTVNDPCEVLGICPEEIESEPGAAIEGQIIADEIGCADGACDSTEDDSIVLGTSTLAVDVREEITRNAYELIRGKQADNANSATVPLNTANRPIIEETSFTHSNGQYYPRWDIFVDDLPDGGVTYLNGDINEDGNINGNEGRAYFRIGKRRDGNVGTLNNPAVVSGRHTFVIINGSLNMIGDMEYETPDDSIGIIVLNDNVDNLQNNTRRGQLTIYKNVRHVVGALFTDGSLVSNVWIDAGAGGGRVTNATDSNPNNDWDITNGYDANGNQLGRQLILSGNILSKNTIGKADKAPPEGPWGDLDSYPANERLSRAQMYDFNYIRRYVPTYDETTGAHTNANLCSNLPRETGCYENSKSFVIRVDPRLRENPPPGFTANGITTLR